MIMQALPQHPRPTINYTDAANTKGQHQQQMKRKWIVVRMENARRTVVRMGKWTVVRTANAAKKEWKEKIAVKRMAIQKWIAVKMVNAARKAITVRIAAKNLNNDQLFRYEKIVISDDGSFYNSYGNCPVHKGGTAGYGAYLCHVQQRN